VERREVIALLGGAVTRPFAARAQQPARPIAASRVCALQAHHAPG